MSPLYLKLGLAPGFLVLAMLAIPTAASASNRCKDANLVPTHENIDRVSKATICLINVQRTRRDRKRVRSNAQLRRAADRFSGTMVSKRFFSHVSPSGATLRSRVRRGTSYLRGSRKWTLGENLGWGSGSRATPQYIIDSWMKSSSHRKHILVRGYQHIGVGIALGSPKGRSSRPSATYTADFGSRR